MDGSIQEPKKQVGTRFYGVSFQKNVPIIILMVTTLESDSDKAFQDYTQKWFTFNEAKTIVKDWYKARAEAIDKLDEKSYFSLPSDEVIWDKTHGSACAPF
jgi:hypothetical protein